METKKIKVTCKSADTKAIDELLEFQGDIKTVTKINLDKLKTPPLTLNLLIKSTWSFLIVTPLNTNSSLSIILTIYLNIL